VFQPPSRQAQIKHEKKSATQEAIRTSRSNTLNEQYTSNVWLEQLKVQGEEGFFQQLNLDVQQFVANQRDLLASEKLQAELAPKIAEAETLLQNTQKQCSTTGEKVALLKKDIQQTWLQRVEVIGENNLQQVEQQHKQALKQQQEAITQIQAVQRQSGEAQAAADAALKSAQQQQIETQKEQQKAVTRWNEWQQKLALTEQQLTALLSKEDAWLAQERDDLKLIEQALSSALTVLVEREQAVIEHQALAALSHQWLVQHELAEDSEQQAELVADWNQQKSALDEQVFQHRQQLELAKQAELQSGELTQQLIKQQTQTELWLQMNELIGSATGNKFRTLAQGLTLQQLVILANEHLQDLAPRYALQPVPGSPLALQVFDHDMGDEVRSVESLSGGESFLVSLSLALALASLAADTRQLGFLFIDEGFGTLDPDSLEMALACLDALQADGRQIGVISHVGTLVERIGVQVAVEAVGGGRSQVSIKG